MYSKRNQVKAVNFEDYINEKRHGGRPPEFRPSFWDSVNDFITQSTYGLRSKARTLLKKRLDSAPCSKEAKDQIYMKSNHIVDGGVKGLFHALHTLLTH